MRRRRIHAPVTPPQIVTQRGKKPTSDQASVRKSFFQDDDEAVPPPPPKRVERSKYVDADAEEAEEVQYESLGAFVRRLLFGRDDVEADPHFAVWQLDKGAAPESFSDWLSDLLFGPDEDDL